MTHGVYAVLGAGLARTLADMVIFGYVPLHLYGSGQRRILELTLITAVPSLVRFVASNAWGAVGDLTGRFKWVMLVGLAGYAAGAFALAFVSSGLQALAVVSLAATLFSALSPAAKALVSLDPGPAGTPYRALAWWLALESWGWLLGSLAVAVRAHLGVSPRDLLFSVAGLTLAQVVWVAAAVPAGAIPDRAAPASATAPPSTGGQARLAGNKRGRGARPGGPARRCRSAIWWLQEVADRMAGVGREWRSVYRHRQLLMTYGAFALSVLAGEASFSVFGFHLVGHLGGSESLYGVTVATATALGLLVYAWLAREGNRVEPGVLLLGASFLYVLMYVTLATASHPLVAALAFVLPVYALVRTGATWVAGSLTSPAQRGGGMGGLDGTEALATMTGALVAGWVADGAGLRAVFWFCAAVAAGLAALAWELRRRLKSA